MFKANDCTTIGDLRRVCNVADDVPFLKTFRKMAEQYFPDKIDVCKDAVSITGISMTYVLNKSLEKNKKLELYSPGGIGHICRDKREELQHCSCNGALKCGSYCEDCQLDLIFLGWRRLILRYSTSFMTGLSKMARLVVVQEIPDCNTPKEIKI